MQRRKHKNIAYYQFDSLMNGGGLAHAVFTRTGGVSAAPFDSLNVGSTVGDEMAHVLENRRRIAEAMSVLDSNTRTTWQVHGADVLIVHPDDPQDWPPPKADGVVTAAVGVPLTMRFADCVPVMLYDPVQRVIGMAHAGWRGTVVGAGPATVRAMARTFDSRPQDIIAGVGPSIGPCCYEVGPEVVAEIERAFGASDGLIRPPAETGEGPHLDLWAANERALRAAGVEHVELAQLCTSCHVDEFFSHRREHGHTGRFGALIVLHRRGDAR